MKYPDEPISTVGDLVAKLKAQHPNRNMPIWFRGQSKLSWPLVPKLMRGATAESESFLISRFKQNATILLPQRPTSSFEWLFLMQHYSLPTRLLDWSESPLVALFFAVMDNDAEDGALWVLLPTLLNERSNMRPDYPSEIPAFDDSLINYRPETIAGERVTRLFPIAGIAPRNSSRMQAQQGTFTINHREGTPIEDVGAPGAPRDYVWRFTISAHHKPQLRDELRILSFSRFQLFPELDSLGSI